LRTAWRVSRIDNEWDRDVAIKQAFGVPEVVFTRTLGILADQEPAS
jgi:hypothetical protein